MILLPKLSKHPFGNDKLNLCILNWLSVRYSNTDVGLPEASNAFCSKPHLV